MITNLQKGNIYKRITQNLNNGQKISVVYKVQDLNMAGGVIGTVVIRDAFLF